MTNDTVSRIHIYAEGFITMSVCAPKDMSSDEVLSELESRRPCGTENGWGLSSDEWLTWDKEKGEKVPTGKRGSIPCDQDPERVHWLVTA